MKKIIITVFALASIASCKSEKKNTNTKTTTVEKKIENKKPKEIEETPAKVQSNYNGPSAEVIINNYFKAIGGASKVEAVKTLVTNMEADMQGQIMKIVTKKMFPNKFLTSYEIMGQKQIEFFDGEKGFIKLGGQKVQLQSDEITKFKNDAAPFSDIAFLKGVVMGEKEVEGKKTYEIVIGDKKAFYDMESGLKLKEISKTINPDNGKKEIVKTYFEDYKVVDGIKLPFKISEKLGNEPKVILKVKSYEVNKNVTDKDFQ